jgi:AhpD family alkylhydroperoxidase
MRALRQVRTNLRVLRTARRNRLDLVRALARRPQLLAGTGVFEAALVCAARLDGRLKLLAELKVASIVACEHCLDIGSALARSHGITERQLRDLPRFRESDAFSDDERTAIEYAEVLTRSPAIVPDELRRRLAASFSAAELAELAVTIAWENERARLNQALGVRPSGFSDGAYCLAAEV